MRLQLFRLSACFIVGAAFGSLAPLVAALGSNSVLLRLIVETWRSALFMHGWWPWPIAMGILFSFGYWLIVRLEH